MRDSELRREEHVASDDQPPERVQVGERGQHDRGHRERYPYRFARQPPAVVRAALPAGDYAVLGPAGAVVASVERKTLENLAGTLSDGSLAFQMQRLADVPLAAVVVEAGYAALFKLEHVGGGWLADQLARLAVRYPEVRVVFVDTRPFAEDWTYRFLAAAIGDASLDV